MSCLDVMYHTYGAHHPYFTTTPAYATQAFSVYPPVQEVTMEVVPCSAAHPSAPSKEDALREKERPEAEYINSKCVLFTYFNGDISSVVDEHFTRALSNYNPETRNCKLRKSSSGSSESSSLTQRNFPASFWDSNYQAPPPPPVSVSAAGASGGGSGSLSSPHSELHFGSTEPYPAALHPHLAQPPEHWHYPLAAPLSPQGSAYHHPRTIHELYPVNPNLDPRYNSLLVPALRSSRLQPALAGQEATSPWTGVFPTAEVTQTLNLNVEAARRCCLPGGPLFS
ncbi:transcription cofactor vestigial-like protein 2 isoform X2 [Carcharodon carcharias]|uniref:transcription cofactor vestigial-like protein 2 isoform X2 n=1 Tax=Carcharodon carcharias TaxID=13397 RepID=UPI001B7F6AB6|nr:transcription cofactor vestigial-like protein 2 isoform X2 [Carcharodon carcharias]